MSLLFRSLPSSVLFRGGHFSVFFCHLRASATCTIILHVRSLKECFKIQAELGYLRARMSGERTIVPTTSMLDRWTSRHLYALDGWVGRLGITRVLWGLCVSWMGICGRPGLPRELLASHSLNNKV